MTVPRCTRQSFLTVLESLTSLTNTLTEIGHCHLLDRVCFESMTTLGVKCFFKEMRTDHDMPTVPNYAYKRARCVKDDAHLSGGFLIFHWAQFVFSTKEAGSNNRRSRFQRRRHKTRSCNARVCWRVWKRRKTGKCPLKNEKPNWHPTLCS